MDLIDRQAVLSFLRSWRNVDWYNWGERNIISAAIDEVDALPSAQPESKIAEILNTIAEFKKFTHTDEILIVQKHGMKVWDEDGVEYELQPTRIYCKDCRHRDPEDKKCECGHDILWQLPRDDRWYCADAERMAKSR